MSWVEDAACGGWPPELFEATQRGNIIDAALDVCAECPVWGPCLADGWWDQWTVRGRLGPKDRKAVRVYVRSRLAQ
jgi:hypothetical protein